jgi:hypothetical protein
MKSPLKGQVIVAGGAIAVEGDADMAKPGSGLGPALQGRRGGDRQERENRLARALVKTHIAGISNKRRRVALGAAERESDR